jgi:hypothetical protein
MAMELKSSICYDGAETKQLILIQTEKKMKYLKKRHQNVREAAAGHSLLL